MIGRSVLLLAFSFHSPPCQAYTRRCLWSDRDQIGHTHMQIHLEKVMGEKKNSPCDLVGTWGGGLRGKKLTNVGKWPNRWADRPHIFHTYSDSFSNEHRLKNSYPLGPKGPFLGIMWSKMQV